MKMKKRAIAIAAVSAYIKSEEEQRVSLSSLSPRPAPQINKPWGVAGRQSMMQLADMMQMKAFHARLR